MLPAGNDEEVREANELASGQAGIQVLSGKSLSELASIIRSVKGVVSVDTGLAHLAAALEAPTVALYGATDARLTGVRGTQQRSLQADIVCSPCLQRECPMVAHSEQPPPCTDTLDAPRVWQNLQELL